MVPLKVNGLGAWRRFVRAGGRGVHYLRAGEGPPVVLLHAAMSSGREMLPLVQRLAPQHTVFAFDLPGFGDTDPLPKRNSVVADAAEALNTTLVVLRMPPCPVYGSHTGGTVALELARLHPERVSALIMDGITVFGPRETRYLLSDEYLPPFSVKDDGSHLFSNWVKARDYWIWFPWNKRTSSNRLPSPFPSLEHVHNMFLDILRAGDAYRAVYGAVFKLDVRKAVAALRVPATFMADSHDVLFSHLDRLPKLRSNQRIVRSRPGGIDYLDRVASVIRSYCADVEPPAESHFRPTPNAINRRYIDLRHLQILVRSAGEAHRGRPILLLHDGRSSSRMFEPLMRKLARRLPVYAPDIPDNGASDSLRTSRPQIRDYANAISDTLRALRLGSCDVYAIGAAAATALAYCPAQHFGSRAHCWSHRISIHLLSPDAFGALGYRRLRWTGLAPISIGFG